MTIKLEKFTIHFSPKCGCSFMKRWGLSHKDGLPYNPQKYGHPYDKLGMINEKYRRNKYDTKDTYGVIRHPVDRLISAYKNKIQGLDRQVERGSQVTGKQCVLRLSEGLNANSTFSDFLDEYEKKLSTPFSMNRHWMPQHLIMKDVPKENLIPLHTVKRRIRQLERKYKLPNFCDHPNVDSDLNYEQMQDLVKSRGLEVYIPTKQEIERIYNMCRKDWDMYESISTYTKYDWR